MSQAINNWRARCRELGLDPQEVKSVSRRYDMYRDFNTKQDAEVLELPRWYKWYRVEKLSEGHAMLTPPEQGCSISADSGQPPASGEIISEADFLALLQAYRAPGASR